MRGGHNASISNPIFTSAPVKVGEREGIEQEEGGLLACDDIL